jgi:hypothetical protein
MADGGPTTITSSSIVPRLVVHNIGKFRYSMLRPQDAILLVNSFLERERSGFRFVAGVLTQLTNEVEVTAVSSAIEISDMKGLKGVYDHLSTAVRCFSSRPQPHYRNTIKEAISGVGPSLNQLASNLLINRSQVLAANV